MRSIRSDHGTFRSPVDQGVPLPGWPELRSVASCIDVRRNQVLFQEEGEAEYLTSRAAVRSDR